MHHTSVVNSLSPWKGERVRGGLEALSMDLLNGIASFPPHPGPLPWGFLLPTFSCSFPMANFPHQRQVIEALEPAPERDRTGFAIAVARQKAAQLCRPPDELAHRGRFSRRTALAKSHTPQRLPLRFAEPITGGCIRRPPRGFSHGHQPPGA